ncbi:hypothetical protein QCM77_32645 [Bradyrhizobium sp. SSUT18]|uniref:hypothetical protein n=1 Tax=Bradyrhizobium sp. SSUT18 TaxID=3040602 RepID=UPI0024483D69|nr:hypothetical protein [Bradyrhizobium sp. SSUT18]MDH2404657.1 hypothetical protein [Bradyrhizobium sp. SSUT18]
MIKTILLMLEKLGGRMPTDVSQFSAGLRTLTFDAPHGRTRFSHSKKLSRQVMHGERQRGPIAVITSAQAAFSPTQPIAIVAERPHSSLKYLTPRQDIFRIG